MESHLGTMIFQEITVADFREESTALSVLLYGGNKSLERFFRVSSVARCLFVNTRWLNESVNPQSRNRSNCDVLFLNCKAKDLNNGGLGLKARTTHQIYSSSED